VCRSTCLSETTPSIWSATTNNNFFFHCSTYIIFITQTSPNTLLVCSLILSFAKPCLERDKGCEWVVPCRVLLFFQSIILLQRLSVKLGRSKIKQTDEHKCMIVTWKRKEVFMILKRKNIRIIEKWTIKMVCFSWFVILGNVQCIISSPVYEPTVIFNVQCPSSRWSLPLSCRLS
jgi:hypothetical protein